MCSASLIVLFCDEHVFVSCDCIACSVFAAWVLWAEACERPIYAAKGSSALVDWELFGRIGIMSSGVDYTSHGSCA